MFFVDFIMERFLQPWDDDLFDDDSIEETDDNEVKQYAEHQFKGPVRWT